MNRTIVVGYDGSDHGNDALALGRLLAGLADADLVVACAYPDDPLGESAAAAEAMQGLRDDAERVVAQARERLGDDAARADLRAIAGASPSRVLHELAEETGALAIVVGPTHHGRALRLLTGSTPEYVLDHSPCAVAVAPDGFRDAHAGTLRQIAVAYDGSPEAAHTLEVAVRFARGAGPAARLRLVTAVNSAAMGAYPPLDVTAYEEIAQLARREAQERLDAAVAALASEGVVAEGAVLEGDTVPALVEDSHADDLLFAGSRGQGPFKRVLLGSVSRHLLRDAACPVVVVPRGSGDGGGGEAP